MILFLFILVFMADNLTVRVSWVRRIVTGQCWLIHVRNLRTSDDPYCPTGSHHDIPF